MDAAELLVGDDVFVIDASAWWRLLSLPDDLGHLMREAVRADRMAITPVVRLEVLYSARTRDEFEAFEHDLDALRLLRNDRAVADAATTAVRELSERSDGYHRVPVTDVLIAAAAAEYGGFAVLHRDVHFDRLAEVLAFTSVTLPVP